MKNLARIVEITKYHKIGDLSLRFGKVLFVPQDIAIWLYEFKDAIYWCDECQGFHPKWHGGIPGALEKYTLKLLEEYYEYK